VQPGPDRRSPLELGQAAPGGQQGLLQRVLGVLGGPEDPVAVQLQFALVGADKLAKRMLVPALHPVDQVLRHHVIPPSSSAVLTPERQKTGRVAQNPARSGSVPSNEWRSS